MAYKLRRACDCVFLLVSFLLVVAFASDDECQAAPDGDVVSALQHKIAIGAATSSQTLAPRQACAQARVWLIAIIVFLVVTLIPLASSWMLDSSDSAHQHSKIQIVKNHGLHAVLITNINFAIVFPDSYELCAAVGMTKAFSGAMVASNQVAIQISSIAIVILQIYFPQLWWQKQHTLFHIGFFIQVLGALLYLYMTVAVSTGDMGNDPNVAARLAALLLCGRVVSGIGNGFIQEEVQLIFQACTPNRKMVSEMGRYLLRFMVGSGVGPMLAALAQSLSACSVGANSFKVTGIVNLALISGTWFSYLLGCPSFKVQPDAELQHDGDASTSMSVSEGLTGSTLNQNTHIGGSMDASKKKMFLFGCLTLCVLRSFVLSGLEVASILLLETNFEWRPPWPGLVVGICFSISIPAYYAHGAVRSWLTDRQWIYLLSSMSMVACCLIFNFKRSSPLSPFQLLIGDAIIFPSLYLADSVNLGIFYANDIPGCMFFQWEKLSVWVAFAIALGRGAGPPVARWLIQIGDQNAYASGQVLVCVAYCVVAASAFSYFSPSSSIPSRSPSQGSK